jgi:hypothetical protein
MVRRRKNVEPRIARRAADARDAVGGVRSGWQGGVRGVDGSIDRDASGGQRLTARLVRGPRTQRATGIDRAGGARSG